MRLSVQLYTVRDHLEKDVVGTLRALRDAGLEYVELAGTYGKTAAEWKEILDELGLKVSGSHIGLDQFQNHYDEVVADNKTLGNPFVIVPYVGEEDRNKGWANFGRELDEIGARLKADGLTLAYHNHDFEFVDEGGKPGLEAFYAAADPANLKAELDLAWVQIGGGDAVAWIKSMAGRLPVVHLKDYDKSKTPQWTPAGQGTMDFDAILPACEAAGVLYGCIELDQSPADPLDAVKESVAYFHSKGLK